jgi:hypothetical protein
MTEIQRVGAKRWIKHLTGGGITLLCLFLFVRQVNISEMLGAFAKVRWAYLVLGVVCLAFGYALRIIRWSMMLKLR